MIKWNNGYSNYIEGSMQKRWNSNALAMVFYLFLHSSIDTK